MMSLHGGKHEHGGGGDEGRRAGKKNARNPSKVTKFEASQRGG